MNYRIALTALLAILSLLSCSQEDPAIETLTIASQRREVGGLANQLAAHMGFDAASVDRVRRFWNAPAMAMREGLKAVDLFDAVRDVEGVSVSGGSSGMSYQSPTFCRGAESSVSAP